MRTKVSALSGLDHAVSQHLRVADVWSLRGHRRAKGTARLGQIVGPVLVLPGQRRSDVLKQLIRRTGGPVGSAFAIVASHGRAFAVVRLVDGHGSFVNIDALHGANAIDPSPAWNVRGVEVAGLVINGRYGVSVITPAS